MELIQPTQEVDFLTQKKIELLLDFHTRHLKKEIEDLKSNFNLFSRELSELRGKLSSNQNFNGESKAQFEEKQKVNAAPKGEQLKPRFGDYTPGDPSVSVDKWFYTGGKKF